MGAEEGGREWGYLENPKSAIETHINKALSGGETEGSFTSHSPDRDELVNVGCQELGIFPGRHVHLYGSIGTSFVQDDLVGLTTLKFFMNKRYIMEIVVSTKQLLACIAICIFQFKAWSFFFKSPFLVSARNPSQNIDDILSTRVLEYAYSYVAHIFGWPAGATPSSLWFNRLN